MEYYAHLSDSGNETLIDHLTLTAELAESNGAVFNNPKVCKQLGLLHDVGKHTENFQKVLSRQICKQDHAIVGGLIYNTYGKDYNPSKWLREHMALIMACHHSFLYSDSYNFVGSNFKEAIYLRFEDNIPVITKDENKAFPVQSEDEYNLIKTYIQDKNLFLNISDDDAFDTNAMSENEKMFYARMLYSCLVDADYSATSIFCNNKSKDDFVNRPIDAELFSEKLHKYYENLIANSNSESEINKLRKQVYDSCHKKGSELSGFVTLTAPTGTGKTLALMEFALEQAKKFHKDRIFIVLPFLSIIDQNSAVYKEIFGDDAVLVDDSQVEFTEETKLESDRWSSNIIVTTSVKFFETLFASKASSVRRLHSIANSVVVFDECQTLPSELLNSTIEILQSLTKYYKTTVLFSTATKPSYEYRNHAEIRERGLLKKNIVVSSMTWDSHEIIDDVHGIFNIYDKIKNTDVTCDIIDKYYSCKELADYYDNKSRVVYIFNTVKHATAMYDELRSRYDEEDCYLITSNFCAVDKLAIISEISEKLKAKKPVKLAATQCIEAGVDFDFDAGAREYAPLESIIQSAGRVCRNGGRQGDFLVFTYCEHGRYDHPSSGYRHASNISLNLAKINNGLAFYDMQLMNNYYHSLYQAEAYKSDKIELYDGELDDDYKKVSDNYKLIENKNQVTMIVRPLSNNYDKELFDALIDDIISHDYTVTKYLMKKLAPYTISLYSNPGSDFDSIGTRLCFRGYSNAQLNWFLLRENTMYTPMGFMKGDNSGGIFL